MEDRYTVRIQAIQRYLAGERPAAKIYRSLQKNKQWFYFWFKRYNPKEENWYQDKPRINKILHNRIDSKLEQLVCAIRTKLTTAKYAQIGAVAIQWELKKLGLSPIPIWTINRIINRNQLVKQSNKYLKQNKLYPVIKVTAPHQFHQFDLVGPRYIGSGKGGRFYSFNLIDIFSNAIYIQPSLSKSDVFISDFLISAWQALGIPRYLQVDNELSFKGSNRYPRTPGRVIRLCLYLGVEIIFIPEGEPWRQGVIEKFNDVYDKIFFRQQRFRDMDHLRRESKIFASFHNHHHRYSKLNGKIPWAVHRTIPKRLILSTFKPCSPIRHGKISFIRLTDKDGKIKFFSESFLVNKYLVHEYIKGTIFTKPGLLKLYYNNKTIKTYRYKVNLR